MAESELVAPPEVLQALQHGRRFGQWIRAACPYCSDGRRGDRPIAANLVRGFGKNRDRPGWKCHRCGAEKRIAEERRAVAKARFSYDPRKHAQDDERRKAFALELIERSSHIEAGDPVDLYLRGRGLKPVTATWPSSLRRTLLTHPADKALRGRAKRWPVMLAVVTDVHNQPQAVHRTYLTEDGRKAPYDLVKMSLANLQGAAVRLGVDSETIVIGEGIESTLAAMMHFQRVGWAALSTSGMQNVIVPASVTDVIIAADNDPPDRFGREAGTEAAYKLRSRLIAEQKTHKRPIEVRVKLPPCGREDFADFG